MRCSVFQKTKRFSFDTHIQIFNNLVLRACTHHLRPINLRSELYDTDCTKEKMATTTLHLPLNAVKNAHIRSFLDLALVTDAEERIQLDKVRARCCRLALYATILLCAVCFLVLFRICSSPPFYRTGHRAAEARERRIQCRNSEVSGNRPGDACKSFRIGNLCPPEVAKQTKPVPTPLQSAAGVRGIGRLNPTWLMVQ